MSSRRSDQDDYVRLTFSEDMVKTKIFILAIHLQDVLKTFWRCLRNVLQKRLQDVFKTPLRHLQDVFKNSSRHLQEMYKTSSSYFEDIFKTSSRHPQDVLQRNLQDFFKAYHHVKLFLLTRLREVVNTFLRRSFPKTVIYWGIWLGNTNFWVMVSAKNLQEREKLVKF